ncbi:MAG: bifunctional DNA-formamidopyrimidine glycosylase/DNA-(apurinic or apyrimidinic site) lyase [Acidobacteria bacterium]|nr:bifunctional DNA-formamidopyrimidine glycosylase/DNA-(apurinic or apyrimidinic site) lyase [Acidobacteriota bacterium]
MPELPEVDLVCRQLDESVAGRRIVSARLLRERLSPATPPEAFAEMLAEAGINSVGRRGKFILFDLANGRTLVTHLRMSGRFMLLGPDREDPKFTHAVFHLDGDERLVFQDQRHFGMMKIVATEEIPFTEDLKKLAPEPFSEEFSAEYLVMTLRRSNRPVKLFLLDQTKVCGVGNIYASEALFRSGIHPETPASKISRPRVIRLRQAVIDVLTESMEISRSVPLDPENIGGSFYGDDADGEWNVYGREGMACPKCGGTIIRLSQGGRSTFYCKRCQRK